MSKTTKTVKLKIKKSPKPKVTEPDFKVVKVNDKTYTTIYHISDIHIRPDERLSEYETVFQRTLDELNKRDDLDTSLLVITGDIYYSKNVFKPSSNYALTKFFKEAAKKIEVVLITGNHDMNEQNLEQIDALTPLVAFSPIHYLRDTGLYQFGNFVFSVSSLTDGKFIKYSDIDKTMYQKETKFIKLYHGMLQGSIGDNGMPLKVTVSKKTSRNRKPTDFKGYDAVLLGDIHKYQFLNKKQTIAYCGSLIQQNHSESLDHHGILVWNMAGKKITTSYIEVENDYGFVTFDIVKNKLMNPLDKYPKFIYARFFVSESADYMMEDIEKDLSTKGSTIVDKHVKYMDSVLLDDVKVEKDEKAFDEIEVFTTILKDSGFSDEKIKAMIDYHKDTKVRVAGSSDHLASVWKPDAIEFRNFFLYGGDHINCIDVRKGVSAIVAPNNTGKTSFVKSVLFGLFGEVYNDFGSSIKYINNGDNKKYAYTDVKFSIGKTIMNIRREHIKTKKIKGKDFAEMKHSFKIDESNKTGVHKIDTNKKITHYIGSKDMFVTLNVCSTKMNKNFATFNKKDMNKFLQLIFKLDVFEKYEKQALADKREFNNKLKTLEGGLTILKEQIVKTEDIDKQMADLAKSIVSDEKKKIELTDKISELKDKRSEQQKKHSALCKTVDSACFEQDFDAIEEEYGEKQDEFGGLKAVNSGVLNRKMEKLFKKLLPANDDAHDEHDECISNLEELGWKKGDNVQFNESEYDELKVELLGCEKEVKRLKTESKKASLKKLEKQRGKLLKKLGVVSLEEIDEIDSVKISKKIGELHKKRVAIDDSDDVEDVSDRVKEIEDELEDTVDDDYSDDEVDELVKLKGELSTLQKKAVVSGDSNVNSGAVKKINKSLKKMGKTKKGLLETVSIDSDGSIVVKFSIGKGSDDDDCSRAVDASHIEEIVGWIDDAEVSKQVGVLEKKIAVIEEAKRVHELREEMTKLKKIVEARKVNTDIDNEIKKLEKQMDTISIVNEYKEIESEIEKIGEIEKLYDDEKVRLESLKKKMMRIETEKSIYENLALIKDLEKEIKKLNANEKIEKEIDVVKAEIEKNEQILSFIELEKLYNKYIDAKDKLDEISEMDEKIADLDTQLKQCNGELHIIVSNIGSLTTMIDDLKDKKQENEERMVKIKEMDAEVDKVKEVIDMLTSYKEMVKYDGVPNALIKKKKDDICKFVNDFIKEFTDIVVDMIDDTVCVQKGGKWFHVGNLGGYESWLISVAFKTALNRFSFYSKSAIMIIDEEVDCVDVINFDTKLPKIFNKLKQFYYCIFLVSHRNVSKLKDWDILIKNNGSYSVIEGIKSADD